MTPRQCIAYTLQIKALPQVKSAERSRDSSAPEEEFIRVEDYLGNVSYLDDVCETRSLIHIWREQAKATTHA